MEFHLKSGFWSPALDQFPSFQSLLVLDSVSAFWLWLLPSKSCQDLGWHLPRHPRESLFLKKKCEMPMERRGGEKKNLGRKQVCRPNLSSISPPPPSFPSCLGQIGFAGSLHMMAACQWVFSSSLPPTLGTWHWPLGTASVEGVVRGSDCSPPPPVPPSSPDGFQGLVVNILAFVGWGGRLFSFSVAGRL